MLEKLVTKNRDEGTRTGIHCSDFGKPALDLYFRATGEPITNPTQWYEKLKWGAGKGVELELVQVLKDSNIIPEEYDQDVHGVIEKEIDGLKITGHMDGLTHDGEPIEIKSINNKNVFDIEKYRNGMPRENYVGQLSMYMHLLGKEKGHLFVATVDGLERFYFECVHIGDGKYQCGKVVVDIPTEIKRLRSVYDNHIVKKILPRVDEYLYKYDIDKIDWKTIPKNKITLARNNRAVIGDWEILYSNWKDRIVELQGQELGYNQEELEKIKKYTAGFSNW